MANLLANNREYLVLTAILALALVLRLVGLNGPMWYDEILTLDRHLRLPWGEMMQDYSMNYHYLFNLQSKLAIAIFGESNWAVRLPAIVFGVGAVGAMWFLARDIAGTVIAHLTALLLAVSYHHIWFSQNARGYTELAFWGTLGFILFLRGMERPTLKIWLAFGLTLALGTFTHLTGAFLFAAQGGVWVAILVAALIKGQMKPGQFQFPAIGFIFGAVLTIALYVPVLPSLLATVGAVSETSGIDVMVEYQNPLWSLLEGVRTALGSAGMVVALVAGAIVFLSVLGGINTRKASPLYGPVVGVHVLLTLVLLLALGMRIWPRFFFADIGFLMLLIVLGVRMVCTWAGGIIRVPSGVFFAASSVAMLLLSGALATRNYTAPKQNLVGAFEYVENTRQAGEQVYAVGFASEVFIGHFGADWGAIMTDADYLAAKSTTKATIFVVAFPARSLRKVAALDADTEDQMTLMRRFPGTLGDGAVLVFRRE